MISIVSYFPLFYVFLALIFTGLILSLSLTRLKGRYIYIFIYCSFPIKSLEFLNPRSRALVGVLVFHSKNAFCEAVLYFPHSQRRWRRHSRICCGGSNRMIAGCVFHTREAAHLARLGHIIGLFNDIGHWLRVRRTTVTEMTRNNNYVMRTICHKARWAVTRCLW